MIIYLLFLPLIFAAEIPIEQNGWELIDKDFPDDTNEHRNYFYVRSSEKEKSFYWKIEKSLKEVFKNEQIALNRISLSFDYWISDPNAATRLLIGSNEKIQFGKMVNRWYSYRISIDPIETFKINVDFFEKNEIVAFANVILEFDVYDSPVIRSVQFNRLKRTIGQCEEPVQGKSENAISYCAELDHSDGKCHEQSNTFSCGCNNGFIWDKTTKTCKSQKTLPEELNWIRFYAPPKGTGKILYFSNNCASSACTMSIPNVSLEKDAEITVKVEAWTFKMSEEPKVQLKLDSTAVLLTGEITKTEDKFYIFIFKGKSIQKKQTEIDFQIQTFDGTFIAIRSLKFETSNQTYACDAYKCMIQIDVKRLQWMKIPDDLDRTQLYYYPSNDYSALKIPFSNSVPTDYDFEIDYRGQSTIVSVSYENDRFLQLKMKNRKFSFRLSNFRIIIEREFYLSLNRTEQSNREITCFISVIAKKVSTTMFPIETNVIFLQHWKNGLTWLQSVKQWATLVASIDAKINATNGVVKFEGNNSDWNSVIYGSEWFRYNAILKSVDSIVHYTQNDVNSIVTVRACDSFGYCYPMESAKFRIPQQMVTPSLRIEVQIDYRGTSTIDIGPEVSVGDFCHYDSDKSQCYRHGACTTISPSEGICDCYKLNGISLYTAESYCRNKLWCAEKGTNACEINANVAFGSGNKCLELSAPKTDKTHQDYQCICKDGYFWDGLKCQKMDISENIWAKFTEPVHDGSTDSFWYFQCSSINDCSLHAQNNFTNPITLSFEFWGETTNPLEPDKSITVRYLNNGRLNTQMYHIVDIAWTMISIEKIDKNSNIIIEMPKLSIVAIRHLKLSSGLIQVTCNPKICTHWTNGPIKGKWGVQNPKLTPNQHYSYPIRESDPFLVHVPLLEDNVQLCVTLEYWSATMRNVTVYVQTHDRFDANRYGLTFTPIAEYPEEFTFCSKQLAPHVIGQFSVFVQSTDSNIYFFNSFVMRVKSTRIVEHPKPPEFAFLSSWDYPKFNDNIDPQYNDNYKEMLQKQWPSVRVTELPHAKYYQYPHDRWSDDTESTDGKLYKYSLIFTGKAKESGFVQSQWIPYEKQQNRQLTVRKANHKDVMRVTFRFCTELMHCESRQITTDKLETKIQSLPSIETAKQFTIIVEVHVLKTETPDDETTLIIEGFSFGDKCADPKAFCGSEDPYQKCLSNSIAVQRQFQCVCSSKFFDGNVQCKKDACSKENDFSKFPFGKFIINSTMIQNGNDLCKNQLEPSECQVLSDDKFKCNCRAPEFVWNDKNMLCERNSPKHKQFMCDALNCLFNHTFRYISMELPNYNRPYYVPIKIGETLNFKVSSLDSAMDACVNFNYLMKGEGQLQFELNGKTNGIQFYPYFDPSTGLTGQWDTGTETMCVKDLYAAMNVSKPFTIGFVAPKSITGVAVKIPPADGAPSMESRKFHGEFPVITEWNPPKGKIVQIKGLESFDSLWPIRIPNKSFEPQDNTNTVRVTGFMSGVNAQIYSSFISKPHKHVTFRVMRVEHVTLDVLQCNANSECSGLLKSIDLKTVNETAPMSVDLQSPIVPYKIGFRFNFAKLETHTVVSVSFGPILMGDACFNERNFTVRDCNGGTCHRVNDGFECIDQY